MSSDSASPPPGIVGVRDILQASDDESNEIEHLVLNCCMYTSQERAICRQLCGWGAISAQYQTSTDSGDAAGNTYEWENDGRYVDSCCIVIYFIDFCERRAALALWHGSVHGCVSTIQEYIALCRDRTGEEVASESTLDEGR